MVVAGSAISPLGKLLRQSSPVGIQLTIWLSETRGVTRSKPGKKPTPSTQLPTSPTPKPSSSWEVRTYFDFSQQTAC